MGLESGNFISDLDATWPLDTDFVEEGNDHLQLVKRVLKTVFPGTGGNGFAEAIVATEDEINYLTGARSNIQVQIDGIEGNNQLSAPPGTRMLFMQATPPTGWFTVTGFDNRFLRIVNSGGGSTGGFDNPLGVNIGHSHPTSDHQLTTLEMPRHEHIMFVNEDSNNDLTSSQFVAAWHDVGTTGANSYRMKQAQGGGRPTLGKTEGTGGPFGAVTGECDPHNHGDTDVWGKTIQYRYANGIIGEKSP